MLAGALCIAEITEFRFGGGVFKTIETVAWPMAKK